MRGGIKVASEQLGSLSTMQRLKDDVLFEFPLIDM